MPLTKDFKATVKARMASDTAFRSALLENALQALLEGDMETGKAMLRDFVNGTIGFEALGAEIGVPAKSLMRMLGRTGNPNSRHLFRAIAVLQAKTDVHLEVRAVA